MWSCVSVEHIECLREHSVSLKALVSRRQVPGTLWGPSWVVGTCLTQNPWGLQKQVTLFPRWKGYLIRLGLAQLVAVVGR